MGEAGHVYVVGEAPVDMSLAGCETGCCVGEGMTVEIAG